MANKSSKSESPSKSVEQRLARLEQKSKGVSQRAYATRLRAVYTQLTSAAKDPTPALALHRAGARTPLFQLECLGRLHRATIDDDAFLPVHQAFKALEDLLGAVDFADAMVKRLGAANTDSELGAYFVGRRAEACFQFERHLAIAKWLPEGDEIPDALDALLELLEECDWPGAKREKKAVAEYFADCAEGMHEKLSAGEYNFAELEAGVHEVRRKVRWLSILPAALDGLIVRPANQKIDAELAPYCTDAVVRSPFNDFPMRESVPDPIVVDSPAFLALSWLIAELGSIKDRGQTSDAVSSAARDLGDGPKAATSRARKVLGDAPLSHEEIAAKVEPMVARFVELGVLERLAKSAKKI
ncbi:MAG: hypothetical protein JNK05_35245 [Myxococcales bacterium]|nr:hypothetical protein [Myxococcales bacterium]